MSTGTLDIDLTREIGPQLRRLNPSRMREEIHERRDLDKPVRFLARGISYSLTLCGERVISVSGVPVEEDPVEIPFERYTDIITVDGEREWLCQFTTWSSVAAAYLREHRMFMGKLSKLRGAKVGDRLRQLEDGDIQSLGFGLWVEDDSEAIAERKAAEAEDLSFMAEMRRKHPECFDETGRPIRELIARRLFGETGPARPALQPLEQSANEKTVLRPGDVPDDPRGT